MILFILVLEPDEEEQEEDNATHYAPIVENLTQWLMG